MPGLVVLVTATAYCRRYYPDIYRRIVVGVAVGAVATIALDAVRLTGVVHGWLPADMAEVSGKLVVGELQEFDLYFPAGILTHYMFGADFVIFYTIVWGKRAHCRSALIWGVVWALVIELGMMTLPPMAPAVGMLGVGFAWPQLFLLTFTAHAVYGIALGWFAQHFLGEEDLGGFVQFLTTVVRSPNRTRSEAA